MKGKDGSDPTLMLVIFAGALLLAAWHLLSSIRLSFSLPSGLALATFALVALAVAHALATSRLSATRRTLASRQSVAVVPADELAAKPETVARLAAQLASAGERGIGAWRDRRASALRIRLASDSEGRLVYLLETPSRSLELVRTALRGLDGVELQPAADVLGSRDREGGEVLRTELILARPSVEPLARPALDPDPLQPFAAAMAPLGEGERLDVCIDLLPARGHRGERLRRRLRRQAERADGAGGDWLDRLSGQRRSPRRSSPDRVVERRRTVEGADAKLRDSGPLFETQILLRAEAPYRERAKSLMLGLLAAFEPTADRNWLRPSGLAILGTVFLGADLPLRRRDFDRRFSTGLFRPARRNVLTAAELAGFLKPPTAKCLGANVLRSGALLAPAPKLPGFETEHGQ